MGMPQSCHSEEASRSSGHSFEAQRRTSEAGKTLSDATRLDRPLHSFGVVRITVLLSEFVIE
jgi:hypothetical protein